MVWNKLFFQRDSNCWPKDSELVLLQLYLRTADGDVWEFPSASWHIIQRKGFQVVSRKDLLMWESKFQNAESSWICKVRMGFLKSAQTCEVSVNLFSVLLVWSINLVEWRSARDKASGCFGTTMYTRPLYRTVWTTGISRSKLWKQLSFRWEWHWSVIT